jgi:restriction system protein
MLPGVLASGCCYTIVGKKTMSVPDFNDLFVPMLRAFADGSERSLAEVREQIAAGMNLTAAQRAKLLPNTTSQSRYTNNVAWSAIHLTRAGAICRIKRGVFRVSVIGHRYSVPSLQIKTTDC